MSSNNELAVHCKSISKTFHAGENLVHALNEINLEVKSGELFMLVGPSGCGKTTLISVIAGILNYDLGECLVFGNNLQKLDEHERTIFRGKNIGFVFQSYNLIPTLSASENVAIPLVIQGTPLKEALPKAAYLLELVGLSEKIKVLPSELSGGQQQRVAIARALIHQPKLIVCDEPTAALDHETGAKVMEIFREVALKDNRTLVIVTHDNRIFSFADRIAKLDDGRVEKIVTDATKL